MGGSNPYIQQAVIAKPERSFRITFKTPEHEDIEVEVDPQRIPYGRTGLPGSLLDIALAHDVPLDHACGGVCACSTCHVFVKAGGSSCSEATEDEEDQLDKARGLQMSSRLACQTVPDGTCDLVVEIPEWNVNLVQEPH